MTLTAQSVVLALGLEVNEYNGLRLTGITDWILTNVLPGEFESQAVVVWNGVQAPFTQTVRMVDPDGQVVGGFDEAVPLPLVSQGDWAQVVMGTALRFRLEAMGAYALEVYADGELKLSRPISVYTSRSTMEERRVKYQVAGEAQLGAVLIGTDAELVPDWRVDNLLVSAGHYFYNPLAVLFAWDYVSEAFKATVEYIDPNGEVYQTQKLDVYPPSDRRSTTHMHINVTYGTNTPYILGVHRIRVSWGTHQNEYPILLFDAMIKGEPPAEDADGK